MKIILTTDDGAKRDITTHVQFVYDSVLCSMDWGSGFLDADEQLRVLQLGTLLGDVTVELASVCNLDKGYLQYVADPNRRSGVNGSYGQHLKNRDAYIEAEKIRRFGEGAPTWELLDALLVDINAKFDDVEGFDE